MAEDEHRRWLPSVCERVGVGDAADDANTIQLFEMSGTTREGSSDIGVRFPLFIVFNWLNVLEVT
jgi:hypothetical protein